MTHLRLAPASHITCALLSGGLLLTAFVIPATSIWAESGRPGLIALMFAPFWLLLIEMCFEWGDDE